MTPDFGTLVARQLDAVEGQLRDFVATAEHAYAVAAAQVYGSQTGDALRLALKQGSVALEGKEAGNRALAVLQRCRRLMQRGQPQKMQCALDELTVVMAEIGSISLATAPPAGTA